MTHQVTAESRKFVENAAGMGLPHEQIATLIGVKSDKTLRKRYRKELNEGKAKACLNIAQTCYKGALAGDNTLIIWWTKTQKKWKEDRSVELSTPPGRPLEFIPAPEPELLGEYVARMERIAAERRAHPRPATRVAPPGQGGKEPAGGEGSSEG